MERYDLILSFHHYNPNTNFHRRDGCKLSSLECGMLIEAPFYTNYDILLIGLREMLELMQKMSLGKQQKIQRSGLYYRKETSKSSPRVPINLEKVDAVASKSSPISHEKSGREF